MPNRTVKVQGWGIGTAAITAHLDEELVFSGSVDLVEFTDANSKHEDAPTLFTFELPVEFEGTKRMRITVDKAMVRFGQIVANYTEVDFGEPFYTGPDEFADVAPVLVGQPVRDPRSRVMVDGILQEVDRQGAIGTWHWHIYPGSVFEHDLNVKAGSLFNT